MKIFYVGCEYDHFDPKRGHSFEHENFYLSLKRFPGAEVTYFPFERILQGGREQYAAALLAAVKNEKPELLFVFPYSDELLPEALDELKKYTTTLAWFADDSWRFYDYSKFLAPHFTWAVTTYSWMPALYRAAGQPNVIRSQWAANTTLYHPRQQNTLKNIPDLAFVGGWSRPRAKLVKILAARGLDISIFGGGWPGGRRVSEEEMLEIFSLAKINLGLNPPPGRASMASLARLFLKSSLNRIVPDFHFASNFASWSHMNVPQIKARHFQIPACSGFVITSMADDLGHYYEPGKEIVIYKDDDDMVEKIKYYLSHDSEREAIAHAGYERTIREHTYEARFKKIFSEIGL